MKSLTLICILLFTAGEILATEPGFKQVEYRSIDGLMVTADLYETGDRRDPIIILFHQSATSRGEYRTIAPKLLEHNFNVLAVDLRWGGTDFWNKIENETAKRFGTEEILKEVEAGKKERIWPTIFASYQDMLATLDWVNIEEFSGPKLVAGSSASAMLILKLPRDRRIDGLLAFSPGEYFEPDSMLAQSWCKDLTIPVYVAAGAKEADFCKVIFDAVASENKVFYHAKKGRHGASTLIGNKENQDNLLNFLSVFQSPQEHNFLTSDGIKIYADLYEASGGQSAPLIILFHQAGSCARGEYGTFVNKLLLAGYNVLATDQRSGGSRLGGVNRTVNELKDTQYSYCDAMSDLSAAMKFGSTRGFDGKRIIWGSSYSAGLVILYAATHSDNLDGVLAFSPASGAPMGECNHDDLIDAVKVPTLVLRPANEMQYENLSDQLDNYKDAGFETYVAANGVHGSSMMNQHRVKGDISDNWEVVMDFLKRISGE